MVPAELRRAEVSLTYSLHFGIFHMEDLTLRLKLRPVHTTTTIVITKHQTTNIMFILSKCFIYFL